MDAQSLTAHTGHPSAALLVFGERAIEYESLRDVTSAKAACRRCRLWLARAAATAASCAAAAAAARDASCAAQRGGISKGEPAAENGSGAGVLYLFWGGNTSETVS